MCQSSFLFRYMMSLFQWNRACNTWHISQTHNSFAVSCSIMFCIVRAIDIYRIYNFSESLTNVFLDGDACPDSVMNLTTSSVETVTDVLRDGRMDSWVEPKSLAQNHFRVLVPLSSTLPGIRVFSQGTRSCSHVDGMAMYGVSGCYGEVRCELRMCAVREQKEQSGGLFCIYTCFGHDLRFALMSVKHNALDEEICEIYLR